MGIGSVLEGKKTRGALGSVFLSESLASSVSRTKGVCVTFLDYLFRLPYADYHWDCLFLLS